METERNTYMAASVNKGYDGRLPGKTDTGIFHPHAVRAAVPAAVQYGWIPSSWKFLGLKALAAVGSTGSINFMIIGFCLGVCSGFAIPVAQKFGKRTMKALRRFVANSAWLAILFRSYD